MNALSNRNDFILANRGVLSASQIADRLGMKRATVVAVWFHAMRRGLIPASDLRGRRPSPPKADPKPAVTFEPVTQADIAAWWKARGF